VGQSITHHVANPNLLLTVSSQFDALGSEPMVLFNSFLVILKFRFVCINRGVISNVVCLRV
jgi:hypothetical protein